MALVRKYIKELDNRIPGLISKNKCDMNRGGISTNRTQQVHSLIFKSVQLISHSVFKIFWMSASRVWALYLVVYLLRSLISYIFLIISLSEALHPSLTSLISSSEHIEHIDLIEAGLPFGKRLFLQIIWRTFVWLSWIWYLFLVKVDRVGLHHICMEFN